MVVGATEEYERAHPPLTRAVAEAESRLHDQLVDDLLDNVAPNWWYGGNHHIDFLPEFTALFARYRKQATQHYGGAMTTFTIDLEDLMRKHAERCVAAIFEQVQEYYLQCGAFEGTYEGRLEKLYDDRKTRCELLQRLLKGC